MASIENITAVNNDSEMEEGEIVDDLDDLSDISSEEEFLLRQRLQVLENYNYVLERKKAKRASDLSGKKHKRADMCHHDLSEISATELEDNTSVCGYKLIKEQIHSKTSHRQKKTNSHNNHGKSKEHKKKNHNHKRRLEVKVINESSEESDDEYRNKRRKLANAVAFNKVKGDISSLKARLEKMMYGSKNEEYFIVENMDENDSVKNMKETSGGEIIKENNSVENMYKHIHIENLQENDVQIEGTNTSNTHHNTDNLQLQKDNEEMHIAPEVIDLCSEDNKEIEKPELEQKSQDVVDSASKENLEEHHTNKQDSDEDLEQLRQHALKTKCSKLKSDAPEALVTSQNKPLSEEDDSDTAELRLICLKSALLKKAIEMKVKQKLRKRLKSKSLSLQDDLLVHQEEMGNTTDLENNTDIESVDMDIGSDGDDKAKEVPVNNCPVGLGQKLLCDSNTNNTITTSSICKEDELEEDEDILRAKLLTSLTKNLPNLAEMDIVNKIDDNTKSNDESTLKAQVKQNVADEKKFIINLEDSDSEGEHEATKNLTKMHMKLSEQVDFQKKLDLFLKSTRMKVENTELPDVVQQPQVPKPHVKYVAKAVNHLPKSEQIEYKNLVKRMAELEKIKQARQTSMTSQNNTMVLKETLKPRNVTMEIANQFPNKNVEERIAASRKNIAEESSKMLKLKEEATKLLQKYKIVATELRNISTAITLNKKEQRTVQNRLSRIRVQHQMLLKSTNFKHSSGGLTSINQSNNKVNISSRLQKENNPAKDEHKMPNMLKAVKVSVVNELSTQNTGPSQKLSVQLDVSSNKKIVKLPKSPDKDRIVNLVGDEFDKRTEAFASKELSCPGKNINSGPPVVKDCEILQNVERQNNNCFTEHNKKNKEENDYQSPLEALGSTTWQEDPNAFLCPYEVGGSCRDPDCKFLHPKIPSHQ